MNLASLVPELVAFLAPFLPYLISVGEKAAEEAGKSFGHDVWLQAKTLWNRIHPAIEKKPSALEAVQDLANKPEDEDALAALRIQIRKILAEHPDLVMEITPLLANSQLNKAAVSASGRRSVAIGGDVQEESTIITGDNNQP